MGRSNTMRSLRVLRGARERRAAEADRFGRDQDALGIEAVQDVVEALALLADAIGRRHRQFLDEQHVRIHRLAAHFLDLAHFDVAPVESV